MAEVKEKHPTWFKMKSERRQLVKELPAETTAKVLLACWEYLETAEIPSTLNPLERIAFSAFSPIWRSRGDFMNNVLGQKTRRITAKFIRYRTIPYDVARGEEEIEQERDERKRRESGEDALAPASKKFLGGQCVYAHDSDAYGLADYFAKEKQVDFTGGAQPTECELQKWAQALQELHDENKVQWEIMDGAMRFALDDEWWGKKCSPFSTSRKNFNKIFAEASCDQRYFPRS